MDSADLEEILGFSRNRSTPDNAFYRLINRLISRFYDVRLDTYRLSGAIANLTMYSSPPSGTTSGR
jgi:hypothetical protein